MCAAFVSVSSATLQIFDTDYSAHVATHPAFIAAIIRWVARPGDWYAMPPVGHGPVTKRASMLDSRPTL
jgi:hypothetical protein